MTYFMTATVTFYHRLAPNNRTEVPLNLQADNKEELRDKLSGFLGSSSAGSMFVFSHIENVRIHKGELLHSSGNIRIEDLRKSLMELS